MRFPRRFIPVYLFVAFLALSLVSAQAQTFQGGISGSVADSSGASVPGAVVKATEDATGTSHDTISSSAGDFNFSNLPIGSYTVTVTAAGFNTAKFDKVLVAASNIYDLAVKLSVASSSQTVEVTADAITLDTTNDTQSTVLPQVIVQNLPNSGRDFTQMLAQTPGFAGYSTGGGAGVASVNGTRSNSVNWQIEGTDNNDFGGTSPPSTRAASIRSPVSSSRSTRSTTSPLKPRGPPVSAATPAARPTSPSSRAPTRFTAPPTTSTTTNSSSTPIPSFTIKPETRNENYGFSVGGPVLKNKFFCFLAFEKQQFLIGATSSQATEPSAAYQTEAYTILDFYGVPHNPVAHQPS